MQLAEVKIVETRLRMLMEDLERDGLSVKSTTVRALDKDGAVDIKLTASGDVIVQPQRA